jgi:HSP20 family protein
MFPRHRLVMRQAIEQMFDEGMNETPSEREMLLAVDVCGSDEAYDIRALVPGLDAEDLEIEVLNNTVTIRGEFKTANPENTKYLVCELPNGRFSRSITLPTAVDAAKTMAAIKNGLLTLHMPKAEAHRPAIKEDREQSLSSGSYGCTGNPALFRVRWLTSGGSSEALRVAYDS